MAQHIQTRRDTAANWASANPTLLAGELAIETDTGALKWGDGVTSWNSLGYSTLNLRNLLKQAAPVVYTVNTTAALGDSSSVVSAVSINSSSARNYTIPPGVFPVGDSINLVQYGTGQVTIVAGSGVTLLYAVGVKTRLRYSMLTAFQYSTNVWIIGGDTA
jgi:hypothetical protein